MSVANVHAMNYYMMQSLECCRNLDGWKPSWCWSV